jgi:hypothetical protein
MKTETQRCSLLLGGLALCSMGLCSVTILQWQQLHQETAQLRTTTAFARMELQAALHTLEQERQRRAGSFLAAMRRPMGQEVLQVIQRIPSTFRVQTITGTDQEWQLIGMPVVKDENAEDPQPPQKIIVPRVENNNQRDIGIAP